jgi:DNA-binding MarR family transcriptional regulator
MMKSLEPPDPLIHAPLRLAVMTILVGVREADFVFLRDTTGATDGNLSTHLLKLEEAKYILTTKKFEDRKPKTRFRLTPVGRQAFENYIATIKKYIKASKLAKKD